MKPQAPLISRLMDSMQSGQPFVTRQDLAAFGATLIHELHSLTTTNSEEYITLGRLAARFHMNRETLARRCQKVGVRTLKPEPGKKGYVRYNVADALRLLPLL